MYGTAEVILFFIVFASQVLLISWLYPRRVISRGRHVLQNYPPAAYPKMYTQPIEYYERRLRTYARLNRALVVAGFSIIVGLITGTFGGEWDGAIVTPWSSSGEWDAAIVVPFYVVQLLAAVSYDLFTLKHQKAMAKAIPPRVRTTELRPRRLVEFVSPTMLVAVALTNVAYIAFLLWYRRFEFPWFTAAGNIAGLATSLAVMATAVGLTLYAPRPDPYRAHQDRLDLMRVLVRQAVAFSIAFPVLLAIRLSIKLYNPEFLEPVFDSLVSQLIAVVLLWPAYRYRADKVDFDVYRRDVRDSTV
jgi:hypothetical protein